MDFRSAHDGGVVGVPDPVVLRIGAESGRILISHDRKTMPGQFMRFQEQHSSPGLIIVAQDIDIDAAIEDLLLIWVSQFEANSTCTAASSSLQGSSSHGLLTDECPLTSAGCEDLAFLLYDQSVTFDLRSKQCAQNGPCPKMRQRKIRRNSTRIDARNGPGFVFSNRHF